MFRSLVRLNFQFLKSYGDKIERQLGVNSNRVSKENRIGEESPKNAKSIDLSNLQLSYVVDTE